MDDFSQDELRAEAIRRGLIPAQGSSMPMGQTSSAAPGDGGMLENGDTSNSFGFMSHPIANTVKGLHAAQDLAGGLAGGAQRLASFIGEGAEIPAHAAYEKITGNKVPHFPVREFMGLDGDNPVDLRKMISHNPDSFMSSLGGLAPAIAAGGASIPGQAVANGLWGITQANPNQSNASGYLPNGRIAAGVEDAALAGTVGGAAKYGPGLIKSGINQIGKVANYLNPNKDAEAFLKTLGSGTKEENVQALAKDIENSYQSKLQDALSHKDPVYAQEGQSNIYNTPTGKLPEGNLDKMAYYISPGQKYKPEQMDQLAQEIKNYRAGKVGKEPYDIDDFTDNVQDIFNSEMKPVQIKNIENALNIPTQADSNFMSLVNQNPKIIGGRTQELLEKFKRRPTLSNADDLQSQLGSDMGDFSDRSTKIGLDKNEKLELAKLKQMRDTLKSEMQGHLERVNPDLAKENQTFIDKYRTNVTPYQEENATKAIANEPRYIKEQRKENPSLPYNVTSSQMKQAFAEPGRQALQIAGDIGETGRNKILYNFLADDAKPEAKGLANAILNAKQSAGYSQYITPKMEDLANQLLKRSQWRTRAKIAGGGLAGIAGVAGAEELLRKLIHG